MTFLVDSHCHLDYPDFAGDRLAATLARAQAAGVGHVLTICTEISKFPQVLATAETSPFMHCTVGTHPHHAQEEMEVETARLVALSAHPKVVGIGETGLDYHYAHSPRAEQIEIFTRHVHAAVETGLPIVVHTREADDDTIAVLRDAGRGRATGVIHCFSGDQRLADAAMDLGFYISFSGIITFKKADDLRAVAARVPLDRMLVETDSPYLAPVPHRGRPNEPAFVSLVADEVARLHGVPVEEVARRTTENFFRLFKKAKAA